MLNQSKIGWYMKATFTATTTRKERTTNSGGQLPTLHHTNNYCKYGDFGVLLVLYSAHYSRGGVHEAIAQHQYKASVDRISSRISGGVCAVCVRLESTGGDFDMKRKTISFLQEVLVEIVLHQS